LAGLLLLAYSDPAVSTTLTGTPSRTTFTFTGSRTFTFNSSRTFVFNGTGGFPGGNGTVTFPIGRGGGAGAISSNTRVETFVGVGLLAVGLLLEVFTLFLWQSPVQPPKPPTE